MREYLVVIEGIEVKTYCLNDKGRNEAWSIGRVTHDNTPDIGLNSTIVSRQQGQVQMYKGQYVYVHLSETNATIYNDEKLTTPKQYRVLHNGDLIRVDNSSHEHSKGILIMYTTDVVEGNWISYPLNHKNIIIGRNSTCDIIQKKTYVSKKHASVFYDNDHYCIKDLDSLNGTWVNNEKVTGTRILHERDVITIVDCHFIFTKDCLIYQQLLKEGETNSVGHSDRSKKYVDDQEPARKSVILSANIHTKKVPNKEKGMGMKEIIRDIHLDINKGSLVALLGGSGAGKSTVMNCLNGMDTNGMEGEVYFQGEDLLKNFERLKYLIGSVPQDNQIHDVLKVEKELTLAAKLRLPDASNEEVKERVDEVLQQLNLVHQRKNRVHQCSGGEMKRVNIAVELVAEKQLLCLDEPDAGLDPKSKRELFETLRKLAHDKGKSIMVIIHDVSEIELFDQVIIMAKYNNVGRLAFNGSPAEAEAMFNGKVKNAYTMIEQNPEKYVSIYTKEGL